VLISARWDSKVTLAEKEQSLQQLTSALLAGKADEARQNTYAALGRGNTNGELLEVIIEATNIVVDLHEVGQYDHGKLTIVENSVSACLQVLDDWLAKSQGKYGVKVTIGPVGVKAGTLASLVLSAAFRSAGFESTSLGKTQTPLELLRNSEELGSDLVIPLLPDEGVAQHLRDFEDALERGGFKSKFEVIPIAPGLPEKVETTLTIARNSGEAISKATEWALRKQRPRSGE
jgi:methanogenic corrinoid protein MtbC1